MAADIDVLRITQEITNAITPSYEGVLSPGTIERLVSESFAELAGEARINEYLALLTERLVGERLRSTMRMEPPPRLPREGLPEVLLVGGATHGTGPVAVAVFQRLGEGSARIRLAAAAGQPDPASPSPAVAAAAQAAGLEIPGHRPEELTDEAVEAADVLVTLTAGDACPIVPGKRYVDWRLESPPDHADGAMAWLEDIGSRAAELLADLRRARPRHRVVIPL
jgi:protein-tyrosine-phosphatase